MLSPKQDLTAAKLFLRLALSGAGGIRSRVINVDGHLAYARAIAELKRSGDLRQRSDASDSERAESGGCRRAMWLVVKIGEPQKLEKSACECYHVIQQFEGDLGLT